MTDVLVDANFLVAIGYPKDKNHDDAIQFLDSASDSLLVPTIILPEVMYILRRLGGTDATLRMGNMLSAQIIPLLPLLPADFERAMEIMQTYQDANLDFVDSCFTAIAERLEITTICTFDRRDFSIIRPKHIGYFELLP